jgi:hypothetical protein
MLQQFHHLMIFKHIFINIYFIDECFLKFSYYFSVIAAELSAINITDSIMIVYDD